MKNGLVSERKVRNLLHRGMVVTEISKIMGLSEDDILRIGGVYNLPRIMPVELEELPEDKPKICPTCKGKVTFWPCLVCNPEAGRGLSKSVPELQVPGEISRAESLELLRIAEDLCGIQKRGLVIHPLLTMLSKRAENILTRIARPR